jgi:hypothetical protein
MAGGSLPVDRGEVGRDLAGGEVGLRGIDRQVGRAWGVDEAAAGVAKHTGVRDGSDGLSIVEAYSYYDCRQELIVMAKNSETGRSFLSTPGLPMWLAPRDSERERATSATIFSPAMLPLC